jgi:hypothetical protein
MKLGVNVEVSHVKEVVINKKVVYNRNDDGDYVRDDERTKPGTVEKNIMPDFLSGDDMAEYVRDYIGVKRWKIVISSGTINIFKKDKGRK